MHMGTHLCQVLPEAPRCVIEELLQSPACQDALADRWIVPATDPAVELLVLHDPPQFIAIQIGCGMVSAGPLLCMGRSTKSEVLRPSSDTKAEARGAEELERRRVAEAEIAVQYVLDPENSHTDPSVAQCVKPIGSSSGYSTTPPVPADSSVSSTTSLGPSASRGPGPVPLAGAHGTGVVYMALKAEQMAHDLAVTGVAQSATPLPSLQIAGSFRDPKNPAHRLMSVLEPCQSVHGDHQVSFKGAVVQQATYLADLLTWCSADVRRALCDADTPVLIHRMPLPEMAGRTGRLAAVVRATHVRLVHAPGDEVLRNSAVHGAALLDNDVSRPRGLGDPTWSAGQGKEARVHEVGTASGASETWLGWSALYVNGQLAHTQWHDLEGRARRYDVHIVGQRVDWLTTNTRDSSHCERLLGLGKTHGATALSRMVADHLRQLGIKGESKHLSEEQVAKAASAMVGDGLLVRRLLWHSGKLHLAQAAADLLVCLDCPVLRRVVALGLGVPKAPGPCAMCVHARSRCIAPPRDPGGTALLDSRLVTWLGPLIEVSPAKDMAAAAATWRQARFVDITAYRRDAPPSTPMAVLRMATLLDELHCFFASHAPRFQALHFDVAPSRCWAVVGLRAKDAVAAIDTDPACKVLCVQDGPWLAELFERLRVTPQGPGAAEAWPHMASGYCTVFLPELYGWARDAQDPDPRVAKWAGQKSYLTHMISQVIQACHGQLELHLAGHLASKALAPSFTGRWTWPVVSDLAEQLRFRDPAVSAVPFLTEPRPLTSAAWAPGAAAFQATAEARALVPQPVPVEVARPSGVRPAAGSKSQETAESKSQETARPVDHRAEVALQAKRALQLAAQAHDAALAYVNRVASTRSLGRVAVSPLR